MLNQRKPRTFTPSNYTVCKCCSFFITLPLRTCFCLQQPEVWGMYVAGHTETAQSNATTARHIPRVLETVPLTSGQPRASSVSVQSSPGVLDTPATPKLRPGVWVCVGGPTTSVLFNRPAILYFWDYFQSLCSKKSLREESK